MYLVKNQGSSYFEEGENQYYAVLGSLCHKSQSCSINTFGDFVR